MRDAGITGADISGDLEATQGDELEGDNDIAGTDGSAIGGDTEDTTAPSV
jgi:hypothetical protein